eukprot:scaffold1312_cov54-Attheya_sp.AAC.1
MISALLELRTKRLGGDPIKARLKTKTERSYSSPNNSIINTAAVNVNVNANAPMLATDSNSTPTAFAPPVVAAAGAGGPPRSSSSSSTTTAAAAKVYAGDRAIMGGKRKDSHHATGKVGLGNRNKTSSGSSSSSSHTNNHDHVNNNTANAAAAPNKTGTMSGGRRKDGSGGSSQQQNQQQHQPPPRGNMTSGDGKSTGKGRVAEKIRQNPVPAPPLGDSHFPALGEKKTVEVAVTNAAVVTGATDVTPEERTGAVVAQDPAATAKVVSASKMEVTLEKKDEAVKKPIVAGYAAALLKAAPPSVPSTTPAPQTTTASKAQNGTSSSSVSQSPKRGGSNHGKKGQQTKAHQKANNDGRGSKAGVTRKGPANGKVGDKQPNQMDAVEMKVVDPTPIAPVAPTWGGGKTFADILKKAEYAAATSNMS